jgi:hypothetical protein
LHLRFPAICLWDFVKPTKIRFFNSNRGEMLAFQSCRCNRLTLFKRGPGRSPGENLLFSRAIMGHACAGSFPSAGPHSSVYCFAERKNSAKVLGILALRFLWIWFRIRVETLRILARRPSMDSADSGGFRWTSARAICRPLIRAKIIRILARGILWIRLILRDFAAFGRPPCEPPVAFEFAPNSSAIWSGASYGFG